MTNTPDKSEMLLPCPFCGNDASVSDGSNGLHFRVICNKSACRAAGPLERCAVDAKDAWNTRASSRPADQAPGLQTARLELTALRRLCDSSQQPFYVEIIDEILAALQAVPASGGVGWQPIESAPKDGTRILIAGGTRQHPDSMGGPEPITQPYIAHWNTLWKQWEGNPTSHDDCYSHEPTHWRPLHAPPALKASGEE